VCRLVAPRGQNRAKVLQALKDGPMTASEIAKWPVSATSARCWSSGQVGW